MARWLKVFLCVIVAAGLALATLPWWLGAVLGPALRSRGITFAHYEPEGYAHFRLLGVHYANATIEFSAKRIRSLTPLAWLAQHLRGAEPALAVEDWRIQRTAGPATPSGNKSINGLPAVRAAAQRFGPPLAFWLPRAHLAAGEVHGFGPDMTITQADWRDGTLKVGGLRVANQTLAFVLAPGIDGSVVLTAQTAGNEARLRLVWSGMEIKGEAVMWEQPLQLAARFPDDGWLPVEASAVAENWRLPAARIKLGAPYVEVHGDARLVWRDNAFELSLKATAEPAAGTKAPPFEADATAHGNLRELTLTTLQVNAPFATAKLTAPVTIGLDHPLSAEPAQLVVQADLSKVPWLESARGEVTGTVTVAGATAAVRQDFELKFSDVLVRDFTIKEAEARGVLAWPRLELTTLRVRLDDTSAVEAHGAMNWLTRELSGAALHAKLGPAWFARWLPAGATWITAEFNATAEGPLAAPRHQGSLRLSGVQRPPFHPLVIAADWQGVGSTLEISTGVTAEKSTLALTGTLGPDGLQLTKLQFAPDGQALWQLAAPARIAWSPVWQIDDLRLSGQNSQLTLKGQGGADGLIEFTVTHFASGWLQDWMTVSGPGWQVQSLAFTGHVADQTLVFDTKLTAQIEMSPRPASFGLVAHGDAHGIKLEELKVVESDRVLTQATGRLALVLRFEPGLQPAFDENAPLELSASTEPDSPLWAALSAYTGLELTKPTAKIDLGGTLRQPTGVLQAKIERLAATPGRLKFSPPDLDDLSLALHFTRDLITVTAFSAKLDGQAVEATGQLPMDDSRWQQLWRAPAGTDWSKAAGRLEIPDADLAPLARRWPNFIAAQGRLRARVELNPGGRFSGELHLTDAASRPLDPLGALRDINADLVLADHLIRVQTFTAKLGSEPVMLDGSVTLVPGAAPRLALALKGTNLPLVRNTGLLLRTDLDLHANTDAAGLTHISGAVTVRDCLVLANVDLRTLLPTGRRGVTRQPPYFSVAAEPFRHWPLAVDIRAPGAVRVRTTAYNGTASARFQLGGTLGEPRAVGELTVDQGQVLFPFATFKVTQGAVRLREADPFHAMVSLNATSQRRDYQLRLEMTGELPAPNVTITSTPPLESADVLLMVMAGQSPANATAAAASGPRLAMLGAYLGRGLFQDLGFGGEDRIEISAGEHVSRQGRETYEFEYKLGKRWSLQGEYDQFDDYNAGLKWHVYTEEGAPLEKK
jgi:translocation and assembly module TamB